MSQSERTAASRSATENIDSSADGDETEKSKNMEEKILKIRPLKKSF